MALEKTWIPYGGYWSSPFCRWQGQLAEQHSLKLAATVTKTFMTRRGIEPTSFDAIALGMTVHQRHSFYGAPWLAGLIGAPDLGGPMLSQACATSARVLASAALEVETGQRDCILSVTCDRTSNGPHVYYPNPKGPGGQGRAHDPVMDNFGKDPWGGTAMIQTAENVAALHGITRDEQDAATLVRNEQYVQALADDRAFQQRYMVPVELAGRRGKMTVIAEDDGVFPTTAEGLAKLRPVTPDGTVTFGSQTHPADGNAGFIVCTKERAAELSTDKAISIQVLGYGEARVGKALMPTAVVPAAHAALARAGVGISECAAIKTHNPFAVNDVFFCKEMELPIEGVNNFGSPLIYGHPQGPTGMRAMAELVEELALKGGGIGLFSGCAAGDTAMAVVLKVG